jgi:hypothetical protein
MASPLAKIRENLYLFFAERGYTPQKALTIFRPWLTDSERSAMLAIFRKNVPQDVLTEWDLIKRAIRRTDKRNDHKTRQKKGKGKANR